MAYDVLAELFVLDYLIKNGYKPQWNSMNLGTHDIETDNESFEVKSTIQRDGYQVKISSKFQMELEMGKPLHMVFVRLEESPLGTCIADLKDSIINAGFDASQVDDYIKSRGFSKGKLEYKKRFIIHEALLFDVDQDFPKITKEKFKDGDYPAGVDSIEYTIDLPTQKKRSILK